MSVIDQDAPNRQWFLYLVRTNKGSLYTGITTDVERRFLEHQLGGVKGAKSLKGKGPLKLEFYTVVKNRSVALKLEYKIKQLSKINKEKIIVDGGFLKIHFPELIEY
jgi:putative endonuclease